MPHRVLIVEDDQDFAAQLVELVRFQGHDPVLATSGPDGLDAFSREDPALILIDVMLPEIHGLRVVEQIRRLPGGRDVPALLMSAVYDNADLFKADMKRLGLLGFIAKPLSLTDVGGLLDDILNSPEHGRARVRAELGVREKAREAPAPPPAAPTPPPAAAPGPTESQPPPSAPGIAPPEPSPPTDPAIPSSAENTPEGYVRVVTEIFRTRGSGRLTLRGAGTWRTTVFVEGSPHWVEVSDLMDGLPRFLVEKRILSVGDMRQLADSTQAQNGDLAGALVELDIIETEQVEDVMHGWIARELTRGLRHDGRFEYQPSAGAAKPEPSYPIHPIRALWEALATELPPGAIDNDLRELTNEIVGRSDVFPQLAEGLQLCPALSELAQAIQQPQRIDAVRRQLGDPDGRTSRAIWFLLSAGAINLSDTGSDTAPSPADSPTPAGTSTAPATDEPMEHHVAFVPQGARRSSDAEEPKATLPKDPAGAVRLDYIHKMTADHYSFLGIDRTSGGDDINEAYQQLAPRYRRQNLPKDLDDETRRMARELLARLVSVYEELSDPARRARYDVLGPERIKTASDESDAEPDDEPSTEPAEENEGREDSASTTEDGGDDGGDEPEQTSPTESGPKLRANRWSDALTWSPGADEPTRIRQRAEVLDEHHGKRLLEAHRLMADQKYRKAFSLLDQLREHDPSNAGFLADLGWCRYAQDPKDPRGLTKALEWVDLSLAFDPGYRDALEAKTRILCRAGRVDRVLPVLKSLVHVAPDLEWAADELAVREQAVKEAAEQQKKGGIRSLLGRKK